MTVSSQTSTATFVGNGVATAFPLPFRFFDNGDIRAYFIDSVTGAATQMVLGTDYTLIGAGEPEVDGNALSLLTTTAPLASMRGLYVERVMPQVQETNIVNQGQFFASTHEDVFDRLTMLIQQANANSQGAIRVAIGDPEPARLPQAVSRALQLMGFNSAGDPIAVAPIGGSASDLSMNLANEVDASKGAGQVGRAGQVVASIAALKQLLKTSPSKYAFVTGYYAAGDGGGGSYYLDPADTVSADNKGTIIVAADGGRWKLSSTSSLSVKQFGAKGDGVTDDYPAISAAIGWLNTQGGGELHVPLSTGPYMLSAELLATSAVLLRGPTCKDDSSNTNGSGPLAVRPTIMASAVMAALFSLRSPTAGNALWGGGSVGIEWNGKALAQRGVWFDNTKYALFDGKVRDVTFAGVQVDASNGSVGNFSMKNHIRSLEFVWGVAVACQGAHGLLLGGNGSTVPATQQYIGDVSGLVFNGNLVQIGETDNAQITSIHGVTQGGGTGVTLNILNVGAQPSHHTHVTYCAGPIKLDNGLIGTNILNYNSEGGGITQSAGASVWDGNVIDYVKGRRFASHTRKLRDKLSIPSGVMVATGVTVTEFSSQWPALTFSATALSKVCATVPNPYDWSEGVIEGVDIVLGTNGTNGGNYRLQLTCSTGVVAAPVVTPEKTMLLTQPALTQYVPTTITFTFSPELAFTTGDHLFLAVTRLGADAADTNTDELLILGARVLYRSSGPTSGGAGTYSIPQYP